MFAVAALAVLRPPQLSPEAQFAVHRSDFAAIAAGYRSITSTTTLPVPLRFLSSDGQVHPSCDPFDGCALYLPAWVDWRGETGVGFAWFRDGGARGSQVLTAEGDIGSAVRELGDGWWWVE